LNKSNPVFLEKMEQIVAQTTAKGKKIKETSPDLHLKAIDEWWENNQ
jgi:hypothetical protein